MFNVTGGEVVIIILAALVILGPEKLPDVVRRAGRLYGELRRMSDGFQSEIRSALDEPTREFRETAELAKSSFTGVVDTVKTAVNPGAALTDKVLDGFKGTNGSKAAGQNGTEGGADQAVPVELDAAAPMPAGQPSAVDVSDGQVPAPTAAPASWGAPPAEAIGLAAPLPPPSAPLAAPAAFPAPTLPPPAAPASGEGA